MEADTDISPSVKDPATRQVLVNIGNRYVVFGPAKMLPNRRVFTPSDVKRKFLERVGDEYDFPEERLVQSVQVENADVVYALNRDSDIELIYRDGSKSIIEIKIRTHDIRGRDLDRYIAWLKDVKAKGIGEPEIWNFNIERLRLNVMVVNSNGLPQLYEMVPLNIWEFNSGGGTFERSYVVDRVADWLKRINDVYSEVENWSVELAVAIDKSRTVLLSEELMQKFAVRDKELLILDLSKNNDPLVSFVPFGLWIFGSNGRIDVISKHKTSLLLDEAPAFDPPRWSVLVDKVERKFEPWNKETFLKLVEAAAAP